MSGLRRRRDVLRALLLCLSGGAVASALHAPLPWTLGPLLAMAAGKLWGARLAAMAGGRQAGQLVIGTALGLYFTPAVASEVLTYAPLLLLAALLAVVVAYVCGSVLARLTGTDRTTAFFASVPGGASEMAVLGARFGVSVECVALAHALRILLVVLIVPAALAWSGARGDVLYQPAVRQLAYPGLALLLALAALAGYALFRLRLPNGWMFGPLLVAGGLTVAGVELSALPLALSNAGQLLIGCSLGACFDRGFLLRAPRFVAGVAAGVALAMMMSGLFALAFAWASPIALPTLVVALAPGGIAEMCITAQVLQLGVPLVTAFHVTRVILLVAGTGPLYRLALRLRRAR